MLSITGPLAYAAGPPPLTAVEPESPASALRLRRPEFPEAETLASCGIRNPPSPKQPVAFGARNSQKQKTFTNVGPPPVGPSPPRERGRGADVVARADLARGSLGGGVCREGDATRGPALGGETP